MAAPTQHSIVANTSQSSQSQTKTKRPSRRNTTNRTHKVIHRDKDRMKCTRCIKQKRGCDGVQPICGYCSKTRDKNCVWVEPGTTSREWLAKSRAEKAYGQDSSEVEDGEREDGEDEEMEDQDHDDSGDEDSGRTRDRDKGKRRARNSGIDNDVEDDAGEGGKATTLDDDDFFNSVSKDLEDYYAEEKRHSSEIEFMEKYKDLATTGWDNAPGGHSR